jgi:transposase
VPGVIKQVANRKNERARFLQNAKTIFQGGNYRAMDKRRIKVVKKAEAATRKQLARRRATKQARTIVTNVSEWINEVKERKSAETRAAIELLLSNREQPAGS